MKYTVITKIIQKGIGDYVYKCEECGKTYGSNEGILAEVVDNKIVFTGCSPFTKLTQLCNDCVEKKGITKEIIE